ncbi:MAG: hypothetical protein JWO56_1473 [Acidobacteria bacterium]|nr:hypothetical protein [Acidobacteriota bacterium]
MKRILFALLATLAAAPPLFAWGEAGHTITNTAAALGLPNDMPPFFYQAFPDLIYLASDPDRWRSGGESVEGATTPDHFLDSEYAASLVLPRDRYKFVALLESSGTLRRYGISNSTPGFLPWRIAELCERLTVLWRNWRSAPAGSPERRFIEHDIITVSGLLGHYAGDAAQPLHTTWHFNGWVEANPNHYRNDCDVHSRFESNFVDRALTLQDVQPIVPAPVLRSDYFTTAVDFVKHSSTLVEPLYRLDREHAFDDLHPIPPEAKAFTAERLAAGASLLRDLWWSTWRNSAKPKRAVAE